MILIIKTDTIKTYYYDDIDNHDVIFLTDDN